MPEGEFQTRGSVSWLCQSLAVSECLMAFASRNASHSSS